MSQTVSDIITSAFVNLAVIRPGETIDATTMRDPAFIVLQQVWSGMSAEPTMAYLVYHQAFTLVAGTETYTVGTGGTLVSTARPVQILGWQSASGNFRNGGRVISFDELRALAKDNLGATSVIAQAVAADMLFPAINIQVFPKPATAPGTLTLDYTSPLVPFAAVTDVLALPDGYEAMLTFNLALALAPQYARQSGVPAALAANAQNSKALIAAKNGSILGLQQAGPIQQGG